MKDSIVIICGPTASGKSELALYVAGQINGAIISADSMQIYKTLDIGTAKIRPDEMKGINHFMIDICDPDYNYSVAEFQSEANEYISNILSRGKIPVVCGGTGFYIHSLMYDIDFSNADPDEEYRKLLSEKNNNQLFDMLKELDPGAAARIHLNDTKRIIRRLEILHSSGASDFNFRKKNTKYNFIPVCISAERSILYDRINKRVDIMIKNGLLDEVRSVYDKIGENHNSMKAIGYKEVISYLKSECSFDDMVELIKQNSRRYAKRQLTWFKREDSLRWFDINDNDFCKSVLNYIIERLNNE